MSIPDIMPRDAFWAILEHTWSGVPEASDARTAFLSTDRTVRDKAFSDLDSVFSKFYKRLVYGISGFEPAHLAQWGEHWDEVFEACWNAGGDRNDDCYDEGGEVMFLCAFIVATGPAAFEAFCDRPQNYLGYSPVSVFENDMMNATGVAQRVKEAREARKAEQASEKSHK